MIDADGSTSAVPRGPILVTGADTGVGKTVVAAGLARALVERGVDVVAVKPVESGCAEVTDDEEDGAILAAATEQERPRASLTRLARPLAPPVAAELEGVALEPASWRGEVERLLDEHEIVVVEGAGGLLAPLAWGCTIRDLVPTTSARALVVSADRLGTLNHTLLTVEALRSIPVELLGVVLSAPAVADESTGRNAEALRRLGLDRLVSVPRLEDPATASDHLAPVLDWLGLSGDTDGAAR